MTGIPDLRPEDMENFVAGRFPHERVAADKSVEIERAIEAYRADLVQKIEALMDEAEEHARNPKFRDAWRDFWAEVKAYDKVLSLIDGGE